MTHYKLGNKEAAGRALDRALRLSSQFAGVDEARRVRGELR
jgi:hypothetical protein